MWRCVLKTVLHVVVPMTDRPRSGFDDPTVSAVLDAPWRNETIEDVRDAFLYPPNFPISGSAVDAPEADIPTASDRDYVRGIIPGAVPPDGEDAWYPPAPVTAALNAQPIVPPPPPMPVDDDDGELREEPLDALLSPTSAGGMDNALLEGLTDAPPGTPRRPSVVFDNFVDADVPAADEPEDDGGDGTEPFAIDAQWDYDDPNRLTRRGMGPYDDPSGP